jgi:hypothetical protein
MKKAPRLTLHRETLRHLSTQLLREAAAGITAVHCNPPTVTCYGHYTCGGPRCL